MPQASSWLIANGGGSTVRAALNALLAVLQSSSSGTAAPSPTVAGMLWYDTTNLILKVRNNANTAWVEVTKDTVGALTVRGNSAGAAAAETDVTMAQLQTMLGFTQSLAGNGWQKLPSGLILQWGAGLTGATGTTITFPTTFATVRCIAASPATGSALMLTTKNATSAQFEAQGWSDSGVQTSVAFSWLAMGY